MKRILSFGFFIVLVFSILLPCEQYVSPCVSQSKTCRVYIEGKATLGHSSTPLQVAVSAFVSISSLLFLLSLSLVVPLAETLLKNISADIECRLIALCFHGALIAVYICLAGLLAQRIQITIWFHTKKSSHKILFLKSFAHLCSILAPLESFQSSN